MKLGISSYTYNWSIGVQGYPFPSAPMHGKQLLKQADALGVKVVQICDGIKLNMLTDRELDELCMYAQELGIELEIGTSGIHPDHLYSFLRVAKRLQAKFLRVLLHYCQSRPDVCGEIEWLREVMPTFEKNGVVIGIENHDSQTCAELIHIVERVHSPNLGICLDTANSYGVQESTEYVLSCLLPYAVNLHMKNFKIERQPHAMGFTITGAPADQGEVDFSHVLAMIKNAKKDINVILELWTPFMGSVEASMALEEKWASASIPYMKKIMRESSIEM